MQVYEAKIQYSLVRVGSDEPLNTPVKIVDYMAGAFDDTPTQESFYVVCLNRKNRPLCRSRISLGTACNTLVHPREVFRIVAACRPSAWPTRRHAATPTLPLIRPSWDSVQAGTKCTGNAADAAAEMRTLAKSGIIKISAPGPEIVLASRKVLLVPALHLALRLGVAVKGRAED